MIKVSIAATICFFSLYMEHKSYVKTNLEEREFAWVLRIHLVELTAVGFVGLLVIQWNPDFLNPQFLEPSENSNPLRREST